MTRVGEEEIDMMGWRRYACDGEVVAEDRFMRVGDLTEYNGSSFLCRQAGRQLTYHHVFPSKANISSTSLF